MGDWEKLGDVVVRVLDKLIKQQCRAHTASTLEQCEGVIARYRSGAQGSSRRP